MSREFMRVTIFMVLIVFTAVCITTGCKGPEVTVEKNNCMPTVEQHGEYYFEMNH